MRSQPKVETMGNLPHGHVSNPRGLALVATLLVLAMMGVLVAAAVRAAMTSVRTAGLEYHEARAFYAAEAGGEAALAQLKVALLDGYLSDAELAGVTSPTINGFNYDSFSVERQGAAVVENITDGPYTGLYALTQNVDVYSRVEDANGTTAGIVLRAKAQAIPIFQFGVFFEKDLEATNGPPMEFVGRVHSNGNIYLSSPNAWYRDMITTPNKVFWDRKDFHQKDDGVFINDASADEVKLKFDSRSTPDPDAFKKKSCKQFDCRLQTDAFGVDSLKLPLPPGVPPIELIRPREAVDVEAEKKVKFAWNADMYAIVDLTDIRTAGSVCGAMPPKNDPDEVKGNLQITAIDPVIPGDAVKFKILGVDCDEFEGAVTVRADGSTIFSSTLDETCYFTVFIPSTTDVLSVQVIGDASEGFGFVNGTAFWYDLQSLGGGASTPWPKITVLRSPGLDVPNPVDICKIFQWKWSAFYDAREDALKDVLDLDIAQLSDWVGGGASRSSEVFYVEVIRPADISGYNQETRDLILDGTLDPAARIVNGSVLPNRMTVASEWPLYVRGDYNNVNKQPAALAGDAVNVLSNVWSDFNNRPDAGTFNGCVGQVAPGLPCPAYLTWAAGWVYKNASPTAIYAAILAGHWPTPCDHEDAGCPGGYQDFYGGGIENFPRFLERWGGVRFQYLGALISPFTSAKTTGTWSMTYYLPPTRDWAFDTDFRDPSLLPPGTPNVGNVVRTAMREAF